jgi:DNA polymerase-4
MIVHFDLDAFYASVAQRDDPALRGVPLAVSGRSRRAVVLTASYEARPFGVRSAMPLYRALELCPHLTVVPPDFAAYRETSQRVFAIFGEDERAVEGLSLDEAFVDARTEELGEAVAFAERVRARVRDEVGLTVSAGVASVKMVAKIASDANKPNGLTVVPAGTEAAYLAPMPVGRLWGIGPKTQPRLERCTSCSGAAGRSTATSRAGSTTGRSTRRASASRSRPRRRSSTTSATRARSSRCCACRPTSSRATCRSSSSAPRRSA